MHLCCYVVVELRGGCGCFSFLFLSSFFLSFFLHSFLFVSLCFGDLSVKDIRTHQQHTADCERDFIYETDSFFFFFFFLFIVVLLVAMPCASVHSSIPSHPPTNPLPPLKFSISRQWSLDPNTERHQSSVLVWSPKKDSPHPLKKKEEKKEGLLAEVSF